MRVPFFARKNGSWIRATPATDGKLLFVAGMRDMLVCLDAKSGSERWRRDFPKETNSDLPTFGFVSSPLLAGSNVIVQAGAAVFCLEKSTGKTVWKSLADGGGMNGSAFSSPTLESINGMTQLLVQTRTKICGLDPSNGTLLWSHEVPAFRGMNILTPVVHRGMLLTSAYGGKTFGFRIAKSKKGWACVKAWELKLQGYMCSPVVVGGHAYFHLRNKKFACVDILSGKEKWVSNKSFGDYWSLIAQGDRILALDEDGTLRLIKANPKQFEIASQRKISKNDTWAHVAVSDNQVIVRELEGLRVFAWN